MDSLGYFVRVQAMEDHRERITMLQANEDYKVVFAVKHKGKTGENEHFHLIIVTSVAPQAFRVRMKKVFDKGKGNAYMSIKRYDGCEDAYAYCFHEDVAELVCRKGVSDEFIERAKQRNLQVQSEVAEAKKKASWTLEEDTIEYFKEWTIVPSERQVAERLVRIAFDRNKYVPNPYLARQIIANVRFKLCDGDLTKEDHVVRSIVDRIIPQ